MAHKTLIFADSILGFCYIPNHADVLAVQEATIQTLISRVNKNIINFNRYDLLILHAGTFDVNSGKAEEVPYWLNELTDAIWLRHPGVQIIINGIIPRQIDFLATNPVITQVNDKLKQWCHTEGDLHFHPMQSSFLKGRMIKSDDKLFSADGMHPGDRGVELLNQALMQLIAQYKRGGLTFDIFYY